MKKIALFLIVLFFLGCGSSGGGTPGVNAQKQSNSLGYYGSDVLLGDKKVTNPIWAMTIYGGNIVYVIFGSDGYFVSMDSDMAITDNSIYGVSEDGNTLTMHDSVADKNAVIALKEKTSEKCYSMVLQYNNIEHDGIMCYNKQD